MTVPHAVRHRHLHVHGTSSVHRLAPETKLAGLFAFVLVVALTPRHWLAAFVVDAGVVLTVAAIARLRVRLMLVRLAAILPFIAFAVVIPFVGTGEQVQDIQPFDSAAFVDAFFA